MWHADRRGVSFGKQCSLVTIAVCAWFDVASYQSSYLVVWIPDNFFYVPCNGGIVSVAARLWKISMRLNRRGLLRQSKRILHFSTNVQGRIVCLFNFMHRTSIMDFSKKFLLSL